MAQNAAPAAPDRNRLHDAALAHLARYATTRAGLIRVLDRRVDRWARAVAAEPEARLAARDSVRGVVAALAQAGLVDDAAFAQTRARSLSRGGRSRRAIAAHLSARGVGGEALDGALPDNPDTELAAAIACTRRRRIGAFRRVAADAATPMRELGMLARAGFTRAVAVQALGMATADAEAVLTRLRQP